MIAEQDTHITTHRIESRPDLDAIRERWHEIRRDYHALLAEIPREAWRRRTRSTRWTIAELMAHITGDMDWSAKLVTHARRQKNLLNMPLPISERVNWLFSKLMGLRATPERLAETYEAGFERGLALLDEIEEHEWGLGAEFFGEGHWTVARIYELIPEHYEEHAAQIRESL